MDKPVPGPPGDLADKPIAHFFPISGLGNGAARGRVPQGRAGFHHMRPEKPLEGAIPHGRNWLSSLAGRVWLITGEAAQYTTAESGESTNWTHLLCSGASR